MATVDYQNWYVTQTFPPWEIPLTAGGSADNITGLTDTAFTMIFHPASGPDRTGTGVFAIVTSSPAVITYAPSAADVAEPFSGELFVTAAFSGGLAVYDPITPFVITAI